MPDIINPYSKQSIIVAITFLGLFLVIILFNALIVGYKSSTGIVGIILLIAYFITGIFVLVPGLIHFYTSIQMDMAKRAGNRIKESCGNEYYQDECGDEYLAKCIINIDEVDTTKHIEPFADGDGRLGAAAQTVGGGLSTAGQAVSGGVSTGTSAMVTGASTVSTGSVLASTRTLTTSSSPASPPPPTLPSTISPGFVPVQYKLTINILIIATFMLGTTVLVLLLFSMYKFHNFVWLYFVYLLYKYVPSRILKIKNFINADIKLDYSVETSPIKEIATFNVFKLGYAVFILVLILYNFLNKQIPQDSITGFLGTIPIILFLLIIYKLINYYSNNLVDIIKATSVDYYNNTCKPINDNLLTIIQLRTTTGTPALTVDATAVRTGLYRGIMQIYPNNTGSINETLNNYSNVLYRFVKHRNGKELEGLSSNVSTQLNNIRVNMAKLRNFNNIEKTTGNFITKNIIITTLFISLAFFVLFHASYVADSVQTTTVSVFAIVILLIAACIFGWVSNILLL
jgi:hypothetical protein